jgi:hypothetical protein
MTLCATTTVETPIWGFSDPMKRKALNVDERRFFMAKCYACETGRHQDCSHQAPEQVPGTANAYDNPLRCCCYRPK